MTTQSPDQSPSQSQEIKQKERLYLVIGTEDGISSSIWPESKLLKGVLSAIWDDSEECSQEEVEYWENMLRCDNNWSWNRGHFHQPIGEIAHLDIYEITNTTFTIWQYV